MTVRVIGLESSIRELNVDQQVAIDRETRQRTLAAFGDVKRNTPVDTGQARNSWSYSKESDNREGMLSLDRYEVTNTTNYIEILNMGSSRQAASNFIESSFLRYFDTVNVEVYDAGE